MIPGLSEDKRMEALKMAAAGDGCRIYVLAINNAPVLKRFDELDVDDCKSIIAVAYSDATIDPATQYMRHLIKEDVKACEAARTPAKG